VLTKACTSGLGFMIGDLLAQKLTGSTPFNVLRCLRLGTYGLTLDGPVGHLWYKLLDKTVYPDEPQANKTVLIKTAADQLIWAPVMTCVFFAVLKTLEGHPELIMQTIQDKLVRTVVANYVLWPAAHYINFKYVPGEQRILYNNCVSVAWTLYLSALAHTPMLDTDLLLGVIDQAQYVTKALVESSLSSDALLGVTDALPAGLGQAFASAATTAVDVANSAASAATASLPDLPASVSDLHLEIPKHIPVVSPRSSLF
jgi:protein Mpv17